MNSKKLYKIKTQLTYLILSHVNLNKIIKSQKMKIIIKSRFNKIKINLMTLVLFHF
jgi:hypothetical protein